MYKFALTVKLIGCQLLSGGTVLEGVKQDPGSRGEHVSHRGRVDDPCSALGRRLRGGKEGG